MNRRLFSRLLLASLFIVPACAVYAQTCQYAPADCPVTRSDPYGSPEDSLSRLGNPVIPREIAMENRLRELTVGWMNRIAAKEGWEVAQLSDDLASGARDTDGSVLAYPARPPHWMIFRFQFIVNKDSMQAWKNWLEDLGKRRTDVLNGYTSKVVAVQDKIKANMDSANYYGDLKAKYMTDHFQQYQKDLTSGNKAGTASFEKGMAVYDKKADVFLQKAAALQKDPGAEQADVNFEAERKRLNVHYRDATLLIVEFAFNQNYAGVAQGASLPAPGDAPYWMVNRQPDPYVTSYIDRSQNVGLLMRGSWRKSPMGQGYIANFSDDKSRNKRIKCDQVQTISVHLSCNASAMRRWLADMPLPEFAGLVAR